MNLATPKGLALTDTRHDSTAVGENTRDVGINVTFTSNFNPQRFFEQGFFCVASTVLLCHMSAGVMTGLRRQSRYLGSCVILEGDLSPWLHSSPIGPHSLFLFLFVVCMSACSSSHCCMLSVCVSSSPSTQTHIQMQFRSSCKFHPLCLALCRES